MLGGMYSPLLILSHVPRFVKDSRTILGSGRASFHIMTRISAGGSLNRVKIVGAIVLQGVSNGSNEGFRVSYLCCIVLESRLCPAMLIVWCKIVR